MGKPLIIKIDDMEYGISYSVVDNETGVELDSDYETFHSAVKAWPGAVNRDGVL